MDQHLGGGDVGGYRHIVHIAEPEHIHIIGLVGLGAERVAEEEEHIQDIELEAKYVAKRIKELVDYPNSYDCFPNVQIEGGVCYFLWDAKYNNDCKITTIKQNQEDTKIV